MPLQLIQEMKKINIELKVSAREVPKDVDTTKFRDELNSIKARLKKIKAYFGGWQKVSFIKLLNKAVFLLSVHQLEKQM